MSSVKIDSLLINVGLIFFIFYIAKRLWPKSYLSSLSFDSIVVTCLCKMSLFWLLFTAIAYTLSYSYFSYIEVNLALIAEAYKNAQPIFTAVDSPARYSLLYGPWTSVANSLLLISGVFAIQTSKLMGLVNLILGLLALFFAVKRASEKSSLAFMALGLVSLCWLGFDNFAFVNRPDSFVIAYVIFAILVLELWGKTRPLLFFTLLGLLAGLGEGCKIHAFIYFVPLATYSWESKRALWSWSGLFLGLFTAAAATVFPFLLPHISIENYFLWLSVVSKRGLSLMLATDNLTYFISFLVLILLLKLQRTIKWSFWSLIFSVFVAGLFGSLVGAGTHHFMPFFAFFIYVALIEVREFNPIAKVYLLCLLLGLSYDAILSQKALWKYFANWPLQISQRSDLKVLRSSVGEGPVELGYGDNSQMEMSYYKPELVSLGDSMILDHSAVMDMNGSGVFIPQSTIDLFKSCKIPFIILPKGDHPWGMQGFHGNVFSENWTNEFAKLYKFERSSQFYSLYSCQNQK